MINLIRKHWSGNISLPISYWVVGVLVSNALIFGLHSLSTYLQNIAPNLTIYAWIALIFVICTWTVFAWTITGIWRSAINYKKKQDSRLWGNLAQISAVLSALNVLFFATTLQVPLLSETQPFLFGGDPLGTVTFEILDNGKTLHLRGTFGNGSSSHIKKQLDSTPTISKIMLSSSGGRLLEVEKISQQVTSRGIDTYVEDKCLSFCTVVFLSGKNRLATPNARLGFHAPSFMKDSSLDAWGVQEARELYAKFNLPQKFVDRVFLTPNSEMWYPSYEELVSYGVITKVSVGGESATFGKSLSDSSQSLEELLLENPLFRLYEKKFPGVVREAAEKFVNSTHEGKTDSDVLTSVRLFLVEYQMRAIAESDPTVRPKFAKLLSDQAREVSRYGADLCVAYLQGSANFAHISPSLLKREEELTSKALSSTFEKPKNYSDARFKGLISDATAQMTAEELEAIGTSGKVGREFVCSAINKFYSGIDKLSPKEQDIVIYGLILNK